MMCRFLLLLFLCASLDAIQYPVMPVSPKTPNVGGNADTQKKTEHRPQKKVEKKWFEATVILGSGKSLQGEVLLPAKIKFQHKKNGILFQKEADMIKVASIEISRYRRIPLKQSKQEQGYRFDPAEISIRFLNGMVLVSESRLSWLETISFKSQYGAATLYTFFADWWVRGKQWSESGKADPRYPDTHAHSLAVQKILLKSASTKTGDTND